MHNSSRNVQVGSLLEPGFVFFLILSFDLSASNMLSLPLFLLHFLYTYSVHTLHWKSLSLHHEWLASWKLQEFTWLPSKISLVDTLENVYEETTAWCQEDFVSSDYYLVLIDKRCYIIYLFNGTNLFQCVIQTLVQINYWFGLVVYACPHRMSACEAHYDNSFKWIDTRNICPQQPTYTHWSTATVYMTKVLSWNVVYCNVM